MCWSGEASVVVAAAGYASGYYYWKEGEPKILWTPIVYFASMEALQAATYLVVDQCTNPANQLATKLASPNCGFFCAPTRGMDFGSFSRDVDAHQKHPTMNSRLIWVSFENSTITIHAESAPGTVCRRSITKALALP